LSLFIPADELRRLTTTGERWIDNLPADFKFVDFRWDPERNGVTLIIYAKEFAEVQAGEPIPEIQPVYREPHRPTGIRGRVIVHVPTPSRPPQHNWVADLYDGSD
jgi:hypothetical protein